MFVEINDPKHKAIIDFASKCFKASYEVISQRHKGWRKADKMDRSFIDVTETDDKGKKKNPFERQIYIPHSRACKDTIKTYWVQTIAGKRPVFKLHGRGPEDVRPAQLNEIVMDYQAERQRLLLHLDTFVNDVLKYGLGSIKDTYGREWGTTFTSNRSVALFPYPHVISERIEKRFMKYEGPVFDNNDPYSFYPDPRYPQGKASQSQFVGFEYNRSKYYLIKKQQEGIYFNIDELFRLVPSGSISEQSEGSASQEERNNIRGVATAGSTEHNLNETNPHYNIKELWVEASPKDLGLGDSTYPREWVLVIAADKVLIRCDENQFAHGGKPEVRAEFDRDGYSAFNLGYYEGVEGLQDLLNFLYNSHMDNVRGYLNNMMLVDPDYINMGDLLRPGPRRLIRLKKSLVGSPVGLDQVLRQLQMGDVTASHVRDAAAVMDLMQRQSHTPDALQGVETQIKRTATEIARMSNSGSNHLSYGAMILFAQAMVPMGEHWVLNNQKFLSEARYYRIAGEYAREVLRGDPAYNQQSGIHIGPDELQGLFDFPIDDGRLPPDPYENAEVWMKILEVVAKTPPLQQVVEVFSVFKELVKAMGVKNIDDFKVQARVMPDEQIARMHEKGDVIPIDQLLAARGRALPDMHGQAPEDMMGQNQ